MSDALWMIGGLIVALVGIWLLEHEGHRNGGSR